MDIIKEIEKKEFELAGLYSKLRNIEKEENDVKVIDQKITDKWSMYNGDCIEVIKGLPNESIHYSIFSPPFLSLYVYSDSERDMGNSKNDDDFYSHFEFLIPQLMRILLPGRLVSVHCSVTPLTIQHDGVIGLKDFPGMIVRLFQKFGFVFHSKFVIWKDPLIQATRTKMLSLAHKQVIKDSTRCGHSFMDEILTFRKPGENKEPVSHEAGFEEYIGESEPKEKKNANPKLNKYSQMVFRSYASPVWFDIDQTDTLNYRLGKEEKDERHICPLQLQVIERCLHYWTNPGDIVLSPFAGIGSEGYESIRSGRKFIGIELKRSYYNLAIRNLQKAEKIKEARLKIK